MKIRTLLGVVYLSRARGSHTRRHVHDPAGRWIGAINQCEVGNGWYHEREANKFHSTAARAVEALMRVAA